MRGVIRIHLDEPTPARTRLAISPFNELVGAAPANAGAAAGAVAVQRVGRRRRARSCAAYVWLPCRFECQSAHVRLRTCSNVLGARGKSSADAKACPSIGAQELVSRVGNGRSIEA